jgi:carbamoyl-phosphate synthase large subunit
MGHIAVKESVFPFNRFPGVDTLSGPEMRSTGEVMGIDKTIGKAFLKAQMAVGQVIPSSGTIFVSVKDLDKPKLLPIANQIVDLGFSIVATKGTYDYLTEQGVKASVVFKVNEGRPNVQDALKNNEIHMIINTPSNQVSRYDDKVIRQEAYKLNVSVITTMSGAKATIEAMTETQHDTLQVCSLQEFYANV